MSLPTIFRLIACFAVVVVLIAPAVAQSPCDPRLSLLPPVRDINGYRLRGDRCEGIYVRPMAGNSDILIASFSEPLPDPLGDNKITELTWPKQNSAVRLRVYPIRERLYYQMDAVLPPNYDSYSWHRDVLDALHLSRQDIGIVAFRNVAENETKDLVYLPLRVRSAGVASSNGTYELILVPNVELDEVYLSLRRRNDAGRFEPYLFSDIPGKRGYYPAERGARLRFGRPKATGIYCLEIGATVRDGGPTNQRMFFYEAGRTP